MAYDPNDPADKAIVDGLIEDALEAEREKHEADVEGLKNKNRQLTERLKKARAGEGGGDTAEIERLEHELDDAKGQLRTAQSELRETNRKLKAAEGERDSARQTLETETSFSRNMLVENGLTAALIEANVAPHFTEAAKALLGKSVTVKVDGDNRTAVGPNDKPR
jgi:chromosome segregation ATPase